MDVLSEWLGETIEQELGQALAWRDHDGSQPPSTSKIEHRNIEDDGKNLRVQVSKGGLLQINKWLEFGERPKATLSDGISQVNVYFSTVATQRYEKEHRKRLSEGTLGGLLQLIDFEIVATHSGPRADRITLHIEKFKEIGSNGSGRFGRILPNYVNSREVVKEHRKKLTMLRDQESTGSRSLLRAERPSEAPSFGSQPCHVSSGEDTQPASQAQFATQAPLTKRPAAGASRLGASSEAQNVSSIMDREAARSSDILARSIANNSKIEEWTKSSTTTNHSLREQAKSHAPALNGNKGSVNQAAALLILLAQQGKAPVPKAVSNGLPKIHPTASVAAIKCKLATAREVASTQDSGPDVGDPTRQLVRPEMEICTQPTAKVTTEPSVNVVSKMPAKRKSQSPIQDGARERISKRDVRIAKDQEALLNSEDSWIPAEPGHREPVANVPISILQIMNRNSDQCAARSTASRKSKGSAYHTKTPAISRRQSLQSAGNDGQEDSESDIPISSGQWPQSPDRNQLPPDSSMDSTVHSDHLAQAEPVQTVSGTQTRRSSYASVSSNLASPLRPSPMLLTSPSRNSEESSPRPKSAGLFSPSIVSNSAGEETLEFRCRAIGCDKSYNKASALMYHIERRHNNNKGLIQIFKRTVEECSKSYSTPNGLKYHTEQYHTDRRSRASQSRSETPRSRAFTPVFPALGSKKLIGTDFENIAGDFETIADDDQARILHGQDVHLVTTEVAGSAPPESDSKFLPQMDLDSTLHYLNNSSNPQPNPIFDEDSLPVRPAPTLLNGAHKSNVEPALMHSRSASPESDLEMTMPRPLSENKDLHVNSASQQRFPSTASQLDAPFTQVKRTPYVNGHVQNYRTQSLDLQSSPSKWQNFRRPPSTLSEDITHLTASLLSSMEKSSAEAAVSEDNIHITASLLPSLENSSAEIVVAHVPKTVANDQVGEDDQPAPKEADEMDSAQIMKVDVDHQTSTDRVQDTVEDHITRINSADTPGQDSHNAPDATFHLIEKDINGSPSQRTSDSKRKASDSSFLSPNAVKRRKRFKVPANFNFIEDIEDHRDPSEGARRYRQEFLESRRSSECSTPIQSPTVPFASQIKAIQPNTEASSTALRCPQLIVQDHLKAAESHIKQTVIDLEDTEDTEDIPSVVDNEESMGSLEEAAASVDSMRRSDDDSFPPALEDNSQGLTTDGGRQESADGDVEGDLHMTDADMQLGMAFVDTQAIVAAVQKPSTHCEVDVDDATPGANDDQFTNLVVGAPGTEPQAIDSEALIEETPHSFSSKEVSMLQQNGSIELDPESQSLDRRELPVDSPNVPVSPSFIPNQNNYDVTALIPPPLVADTKNPLLDGQETEDLEPRLLATSSRIDSMIDEPPPTQEDISDAVRQSTAYDLARPISRLTEPTLSDIPALDADRSKQPPKLASLEMVDDAPTPAPANIFERFKVAYPTYPGDVKQFVAICRKISSLIRSNRMEHPSLWDDFIIRHKIEYAQYLRQCAEDAEDPLPYEEFYRNEIEEPQYHSRIITRRNLDEVLSLIEQVSNSKKEPRKAGKSEGSQDQIDDSKRSARSEALVATPSKTSTTQVTIDLTKDDQGSNSRDMTQSTQHHVPTSNRKKTRRSIPWDELEDNGNNNSPILGLATPANTTTPRKRTISNLPRSGTLKSKPPLGSSGPLLNETHAEPAKLLSSASESLRSLKRKKSDPLVSGSTSTATTSSKMEGPPRTEAENRTDRLYESLIRGQWGVGPYEVLEPKYVGQLHQNALILLLFIARNVGLEDGRRLLMERIQRRIANSPNSPQMLTKADLKAVEEMAAGQKETNRNFRSSHREQESREMRVRGMTTLVPLSLPQADTVEEVRNESKVKEWWQDDDSPFKAFARAYASIQPGKGNSYPKKGSDKKERVENVAKEQKQIIDILGWSL